MERLLRVCSSYQTIGRWIVLLVLFVAFYNFFSHGGEEVQEPSFTTFLTKVEEKKVKGVSIKGNTYSGTFTDTNEQFGTTGRVGDSAIMSFLRDQGVAVRNEK